MRIIIVSDNHGNQNILKILYHIYSSLYKDNVKFIHLGDSQATNINDLNNFICVKGNNDTLDLPKFQRLTVLDKRIHFSQPLFLSHVAVTEGDSSAAPPVKVKSSPFLLS